MKKLFFIISLIILIVLIILIGSYYTGKPAEKPVEGIEEQIESNWPGWAPADLGLAVSPDGQTAYIPFNLDDALLILNLSTFKVIDSINVSAAGKMLFSNNAILTQDGKRLYIANAGTRNVMVINTEDRSIEKVFPIKALWAVPTSMSQDGSKAYITSEDSGLNIINTSDNSYYQISIPGLIFGPVVPSRKNPDLLYSVGTTIEPGNIFSPTFFIFDISSNKVVRSSKLNSEVMPSGTFTRDFIINSDETRAYFGWFHMDDRGSGSFNVFDLENFQVLASTPIDYGVTDFVVNERTNKVYIIGFWAGGGAPGKLPIIEYDLSTNRIVRRIMVSPSSDQRAIALDPINDNYLYMTEGDFNLIRRVDISAGMEVNGLYFSKAVIQPYAIIPDGEIGYLFSRNSGDINKLNLSSGVFIDKIDLSFQHSGWGFHEGNLYVASDNKIFVINPLDGSIVKEYRIATDFNPGFFTFFDDMMVTVDFREGGMIGRKVIFFDTEDMSIIKSIDLPNEPHGEKVIISPDESKIYTARGPMGGAPATITIFNSSNLEVINTIEIPYVNQRNGMTGFNEADFDTEKRIVYLTGFTSIYKIDMDTNELIGILDMLDLYEQTKKWGWSPTGLCGVTLSNEKDRLFITSGDAHSLFTYDLEKSEWSTKITNLGGYFNTDAVASPDKQYLYTVNEKSDSITMVNLTSGEVVRIIRLS